MQFAFFCDAKMLEIAAIAVLENTDPESDEFCYALADLHVCSTPHSARNGSLKIFTTRQSGFQRFQKKLMIINPISASLLTILK